ncbi:MAG: hypothetical protein RBU35_20660 [Anaerolineae bacterium]|jgi:hypothetical protein|nr:hypothetical protein [Anaerolineae bacterium]
MTGDGLAPDDIGAASLEDIQLAVEHCARHWPPRMLSLTAILEKPNFWTYVGQAKAPPTPARGAPQLDAAGIELLKHVIYADEEG